MSDNVNHPQHYEGHTSLECIDVMEMLFGSKGVAYFCACNAFKYLWRYKNKNGQEDLEKAMWYIKRFDRCLAYTDKQWSERPRLNEAVNKMADILIKAKEGKHEE